MDDRRLMYFKDPLVSRGCGPGQQPCILGGQLYWEQGWLPGPWPHPAVCEAGPR